MHCVNDGKSGRAVVGGDRQNDAGFRSVSVAAAEVRIPRPRTRTARRNADNFLGAMFLAAGALLASASPDVAAFATDACLVARGGTNCTANDGSIAAVNLNTSNMTPGVNPTTCMEGSTITVDLLVELGTINASNRSDVGVYFSKDGKSISVAAGPTGATTCSVLSTPVPAGVPPVNGTFPSPFTGTWSNFDGNACGDLDKSFGQGTVGNPAWVLPTGPIQVTCVAGAGGKLAIPAGVSYRQNAGTCVVPAADVSPGTSSKCNYANALVNIDVVNTITVSKNFVPDSPGTTVPVGLVCTSGTVTSTPLPVAEGSPAVFTVAGASAGATCTATETVPSGYTVNQAGCAGVALNGSCTITNTAITPQMTIVKNTVGANGTFGFSVTGATPVSPSITTVGNTGTQVLGSLAVGSVVNVVETIPPGWDLTNTVCTNARTGGSVVALPVTLAPGDNITCTFTNTAIAPQFHLHKIAVGADGTFSFAMTNATPNPTVITTTGGTGDQVTGGLSIGSVVNAVETVPTGWSLTSTSCTNLRPGSPRSRSAPPRWHPATTSTASSPTRPSRRR